MKEMNRKLLILFLLTTSCISPLDKGETKINLNDDVIKKNTKKKPLITDVKLENDELKIFGENLSSITSAKLDSQTLSVISNSASSIILSAPSAVLLTLNSALNLFIETSYGATSVAVTFNLVDGSVTASKIGDGEIGANHLSQMGASAGQVMMWSGSAWIPTDFSGLAYLGAWDATQGSTGPANGAGTTAGEYYVVSNPGTTDVDGITSWSAGDWVIWNGLSWDKIDNSTGVKSFNGRVGIVSPQSGDYDLSMLGDVDTTGLVANKILKYDGSQWIVADDLASGGVGSVSSSEILDGSIQSTDLNSSINSTLSQVGTNTSNISTNSSDIATNTSDISTNTANISSNTSSIATNTSNIATNTSSISSLTSFCCLKS